MAYALIASKMKGAADFSNLTTDALDSTGADLAIFAVGQDNLQSILATPTDSKSNSWTAATPKTFSASAVGFYYSPSPTVGSGHTASYTKASAYPVGALLVFSGAKLTSPLDQQSSSSVNSTSLAAGSITPSEDNCLVVALLAHEGPISGLSIDAGFTILHSSAWLSPGEGYAVAYKIQTTAAAVNPTWSWTGTAQAGAVIASFKSASAPPAAVKLLTLLGVG